MRNFLGLAILGGAMLAAVPASATQANFDFLNCTGSGGVQCSSNLSAYGPVASTGVTGINATATAYFVQGSATAPTGSNTFQTGEVGSYSGNGLGICENQTGNNCAVPYHQIDNGVDPSSGNTGATFEFMLIQFSAAVNLSDVQLGNYGLPSGTTQDANGPFDVSYFTSSASSLTTAINSMTYSQLLGGADGFSALQSTSCTSGLTLDQTVQSASTSNCSSAGSGEAMDTLSGTNVTYLLIGASVSNAGNDYFKIQDIDASKTSATPEPATFGLLGLALTGLGVYGRKRKASRS